MIMLLKLLEVSLNNKYKLERRQLNTKRNQPPRSSSSFQLAENINYSQICRKKKKCKSLLGSEADGSVF